MTEITKKNAKNLSVGDLILLCEAEGIQVVDGDDATTLRKKLRPAKPKPLSK